MTTYLDGWQLRYSPGVYDRRANSVLLLFGVPIGDLSDNINAVERFYWDCDLPSRFMASPASMPEGIDQTLAKKGYLIEASTFMQSVHLHDVLQPCGPIDGVELIYEPTNSWLAVYMEKVEDQHEISLKADFINHIANDHVLEQINDHSGPVAVGLGVCGQKWNGILCMHTLKLYRRQGYVGRILVALADWARVKGGKAIVFTGRVE